MNLNSKILFEEAVKFCKIEELKEHKELIGVTDGKAVGTYIEKKFQEYLKKNYTLEIGNSAVGIDLPGELNTDIKVTSIKKPQSSSPFRDAKQKIYGLGYNLLVFAYDKEDTNNSCTLNFEYCTYIDKSRTADYTITSLILEMLKVGANEEDIIGLLNDRKIPGDEIIKTELAKEILNNPPVMGYLTISNAFQWRLNYKRVISLDNEIQDIKNYTKKERN